MIVLLIFLHFENTDITVLNSVIENQAFCAAQNDTKNLFCCKLQVTL